MTTVADLVHALQEVFTPTADRLARSTGFVQRTSQLTGAVLAQALVFGWLAPPHASLEALTQVAAAGGGGIRAQGRDKRCTAAAAVFREELLAAAVHAVIAADPVAIPLLSRFSAVVRCESSTIPLPRARSPWWPGCTPGTAARTRHVRYDLCTGPLSGPLLSDGRPSDRSTPVPRTARPRGALRRADRGYFTLGVFAPLRAQGVVWLSRLLRGTAVFTLDGERWEVRALLPAHQTRTVDLSILLGVRHQLPARLLAVRLSQEMADHRRHRLRPRAREKGETPSATAVAGCDGFMLVTTGPPAQLSRPEARVLRRARGQVDLLFNLWKSHGQVETAVRGQPGRVLCAVYAQLLALVVQHGLLLTGGWSRPDRSRVKAAQTIRAPARHLVRTLACPVQRAQTMTVIHRCLAAGCRLNQRTKTPTTCQLLLDPALGGLG